MPRENRLRLIRKIESLRQSAVIAYITGDRENVGTRVAPDIVRVFSQHLEALGAKPRLDLLLYTRGGDVLTPWRLVNLIREYTDYFSVLVPFRAYSAGTLICLGANEIVMGKMGELGPIDPSVANAFNPQDPVNPQARIPVSVEDVSSYLALAREKAQLGGPELADAFAILAEKVHPLALGNVHRNYALIRSLAYKLLRLHYPPEKEELMAEIVNSLTERLYSHNHMISRREAREDIHLHITYPDGELEKVMNKLYADYEADLKLLEPFNPSSLLAPGQAQVDFEVSGGIIESSVRLDSFVFNGTVTRSAGPDGLPKVNVEMASQCWKRIV